LVRPCFHFIFLLRFARLRHGLFASPGILAKIAGENYSAILMRGAVKSNRTPAPL